MPVPTQTFRNTKKLNLIFAVSSLVLLGSTLWMVLADHTKPWRNYQIQRDVWETAMTLDAQDRAITREFRNQLEQLKERIEQIRREDLPTEEIVAKEKAIAQLQSEIGRRGLKKDVKKSHLTPTSQQMEKAKLKHGEASKEAEHRREEFAQRLETASPELRYIAEREVKLVQLEAELAQLRTKEIDAFKELANLEGQRDQYQEKLDRVDPRGLDLVDQILRNSPLLDWANPSLKVQQVVTKDVRTDYNFMTVETIDRCHTCHININEPRYDKAAQIAFVERQVAIEEGQDVSSIGQPVVMLDFWIEAVRAIAALETGLEAAQQKALDRVNESYRDAGEDPHLESADALSGALLTIASELRDRDDKQYDAFVYFRTDLQTLLAGHLGPREFAKLVEFYRHKLIERYNGYRDEQGRKPVDPSPVLLAHPRLDLYVEAESNHPMKAMGCSVCHAGSGQETIFEHTAHTPRSTWVDNKTGALVPDFLVDDSGSLAGGNRNGRTAPMAKTHVPADAVDHQIVMVSDPGPTVSDPREAEDHENGHHPAHLYTHYDVNINKASDQGGYDPKPFAPSYEPTDDLVVAYRMPGGPQGFDLGRAVRQRAYWRKHFGWHQIKYMYWEKPMHQLDYVESSCTRCHTEVYDLKQAAPRLFKGRRLFAQLGCANCHAADVLNDALDVKKVGPSLVHVKRKLSAQMMAAWIWAPKAFRPSTRMPHYFMLENNSSPVDIKRTRIEVAAITHYLMEGRATAELQIDELTVQREALRQRLTEVSKPVHKERVLNELAEADRLIADLGAQVPVYAPESPPVEIGDPQRGREIFNNVGCLACHSNLDEFGKQWITQDLLRRGAGEEAEQIYDEMTYNQRHWYALEHFSDKFERTGPELSGVGTKLKTGRSEEQARRWLYDWLRNPRHYNSYTIMPNFRLSEDEANDLAAYLLTLERPGYEGDGTTYTPGDFSLNDADKAILLELLAVTEGSKSTLDLAREEIAAQDKTTSHRLLDFGRKMITHYGCNGCHLINGFEQAVSACTNLDGWGLKDPHKLALEYFDHVFEKERERPIELWKVKHEGLKADAAHIDEHAEATGKVNRVLVDWEHIDGERRPWLYHKLHNPRIYDRGRGTLDGHFRQMGSFQVQAGDNVGKPYTKLKMPKFFLTDAEVEALVTFVTSIRKPLVNPNIQQVTDETGDRIVRGRQLATLYNCYGCHNIEGEQPSIQQYFNVRLADGSYDENALNWAPPRLIGQGAKTQPDWLYHFIQNVESIRPWLKVRMPSFPLSSEHARGLVDYLAGHSQWLSRYLGAVLEPIDQYKAQWRKSNPGGDWSESRWFEHSALADEVEALQAFAIAADLVTAADLDVRQIDSEDLATNWSRVLTEVGLLAETYATDYPYIQKHKPRINHERLVEGQELFTQMGCMTGQCHRVGDEQVLINEGFLKAPNPFPRVGEADVASGDEEDEGWDDEEQGDDEEEQGYGDDEGGYADEEEGDWDSEEPEAFTLTPGDPADGAPNLHLVAQRLQPRWVRRWLQYSRRMQPGTRMQEYWPDDKSHFDVLGDEKRQQMERRFTSDYEQQFDLIMDFLYSVGPKGLTFDPQGNPIGNGASPSSDLKAVSPEAGGPEMEDDVEQSPSTPEVAEPEPSAKHKIESAKAPAT